MSEINVVDLYEFLEDDESLVFGFCLENLVLRATRGDYVLYRYLTYDVLTSARFDVMMSEVERAFKELREY